MTDLLFSWCTCCENQSWSRLSLYSRDVKFVLRTHYKSKQTKKSKKWHSVWTRSCLPALQPALLHGSGSLKDAKLDLNKADMICDALCYYNLCVFPSKETQHNVWKKKKNLYSRIFFFLSWSQSQHYNVIKWQIYKIKLTDAYTSLYHDQTQKEVHMCSLNTCFYIALKSSYSFLCTLSVLL